MRVGTQPRPQGCEERGDAPMGEEEEVYTHEGEMGV